MARTSSSTSCGLDLGLGEELGGAETELAHFGVGDVAAGVDDQRQGAQGGLLAQPVDEREAVAVGEGEIEDEQVGRAEQAVFDGLLAGGWRGRWRRSASWKPARTTAARSASSSTSRMWPGPSPVCRTRPELGEQQVFVEGLLHPALRDGWRCAGRCDGSAGRGRLRMTTGMSAVAG